MLSVLVLSVCVYTVIAAPMAPSVQHFPPRDNFRIQHGNFRPIPPFAPEENRVRFPHHRPAVGHEFQRRPHAFGKTTLFREDVPFMHVSNPFDNPDSPTLTRTGVENFDPVSLNHLINFTHDEWERVYAEERRLGRRF